MITAAMLVHQTIPVGVQLFSYVNTSFLFQYICMAAGHVNAYALVTSDNKDSVSVI